MTKMRKLNKLTQYVCDQRQPLDKLNWLKLKI